MAENLIWPGVVVILGVVALLLLRAPISEALRRVKTISKEGASFGSPQEGREDTGPPLALVEMLSQPTYATILAREQYLKNQLTTLNYGTQPEQITALLRALAQSHVLHHFDNISHLIYGTQVRFLVHLAGSAGPISNMEAEARFKLAQEQFPSLHGDKNLDAWLRYLSLRGLIENKDGHIDITQDGKDFLKYLVDSRMAYDRYG